MSHARNRASKHRAPRLDGWSRERPSKRSSFETAANRNRRPMRRRSLEMRFSSQAHSGGTRLLLGALGSHLTETLRKAAAFKRRTIARRPAQGAAAAVNFVWIFCNETQTKAVKAVKAGRMARRGRPRSAEQRRHQSRTRLPSQTVQKICEQYDTSRQQHGKPWLNRSISRP
jgi:hypothetical protein